jgi:hypothetical protein
MFGMKRFNSNIPSSRTLSVAGLLQAALSQRFFRAFFRLDQILQPICFYVITGLERLPHGNKI